MRWLCDDKHEQKSERQTPDKKGDMMLGLRQRLCGNKLQRHHDHKTAARHLREIGGNRLSWPESWGLSLTSKFNLVLWHADPRGERDSPVSHSVALLPHRAVMGLLFHPFTRFLSEGRLMDFHLKLDPPS